VIQEALIERGGVDIPTIGPRDVNIACIVRDQRKSRTQKLIIYDFSIEAELNAIEACEKMRARSTKAELEINIVYRLKVDRSKSASRSVPLETPHRLRESRTYRPGTTPVSEDTFVQDGSPRASTRRTRTNEHLEVQEIRRGIRQSSSMAAREERIDAQRTIASYENDITKRWRCNRDQCPNYLRFCFVIGFSDPPRHYNLPDSEIKRWATIMRSAGQGDVDHPPELIYEAILRPGTCEEVAAKKKATAAQTGGQSRGQSGGGSVMSDLTGVLTVQVLDRVSERLLQSAPSITPSVAPVPVQASPPAHRELSSSPIRQCEDADIIKDFFTWIVAKQTNPTQIELWQSAARIVPSYGWTLRELKKMKTVEPLCNEAVAAGIRAPIARQFREKLAQYKALIKADTNQRLAAMRDGVAATVIAEVTRTATVEREREQ
jgi:hypothetical protein